jgi:hypothetical protein
MGADSLAKNTTNAPKFICPICLPKPKSSGFQQKKASLGVRSPGLLLTAGHKSAITVHSAMAVQLVQLRGFISQSHKINSTIFYPSRMVTFMT